MKEHQRQQRAGLNILRMVSEIRQLSSGTVAKLCGSALYQIIDEYTADWVQWVLKHDLSQRWDTWQDCHEEYEEHLAFLYQCSQDSQQWEQGVNTIAASFASLGEEDSDPGEATQKGRKKGKKGLDRPFTSRCPECDQPCCEDPFFCPTCEDDSQVEDESE